MPAIIELKVKDSTKAYDTLYSALQRESKLLTRSIDRTKQNILSFEGKYNLSSQIFLKEYPGMSDDPDFIDWYGEIRILDALNSDKNRTRRHEQIRPQDHYRNG